MQWPAKPGKYPAVNKRFVALSGAVGAAALFRLAPHPPNFTPIEALALFGGASFASRRAAFLVPLAAMLLSDLVLGLHYGALAQLHSQPVVYACILATVAIGRALRGRRSPQNILAASLAGSVLFFVVTNFAVWAGGSMYPFSIQGLAGCYVAAIPFFRNALTGDLAFTAAIFGGFALLERYSPALREPAPCVA